MVVLTDKQAGELDKLIGELPGKYSIVLWNLFEKFAKENAEEKAKQQELAKQNTKVPVEAE